MLGHINQLRSTVEGRMVLTFVVTILLLGAGTRLTRIEVGHSEDAEIANDATRNLDNGDSRDVVTENTPDPQAWGMRKRMARRSTTAAKTTGDRQRPFN